MSAEPETNGSQEILNCHWPAHPAMLVEQEHAVPVRVRVAFARDGECFIEGWAKRWDYSHVLVAIDDPRVESNEIWLKPHDVYRRMPTAQSRNARGARSPDNGPRPRRPSAR
ncbi:hypothetical protein [Phytoactinopolyspora mesophila]|uniref:Uncharacterized protein n=1 Tax=Phytoactinopolyspora mesophila TaxID=2650750 RepID=A0A7K3M126_9ACTN|nr:hypothetical protein [Phytoactinopolyspora mesophila]NDL57005.1 hypothetical protein [Phytoactinopolyspora mesophila]